MLKYNPDIIWKDIDSLIPYINNTKQHPDNQIDKIAGSIAEFGFDQPIVIDGDGVIIKGHGRLIAAKKLKLQQVPVLIRTDLTPSQVKAARIADNRVSESDWDEELLKIELYDLQQHQFDLSLTGFDAEEIGRFLTDEKKEVIEDNVETTESKADELQHKWQVQEGDLWECGEHRVLCADCNDQEVVSRLLDRTIDLMLTDPPYGVERDKGFGGADGFSGTGKPIKRRNYLDEWDGKRPLKETFDYFINISKESIIFGGNFFADILPMSTHWLVWDKHNTMPTFGDCELAWTSFDRKSVKKYDVEYNGLIGKEKERFHPTQKPVKLFSQIIDDYTDVGAIIFDPYAGSGTTLMAAEQTGRIARVVERMPSYVAVILERWSVFMNQAPRKL